MSIFNWFILRPIPDIDTALKLIHIRSYFDKVTIGTRQFIGPIRYDSYSLDLILTAQGLREFRIQEDADEFYWGGLNDKEDEYKKTIYNSYNKRIEPHIIRRCLPDKGKG
jgi:hypothetical protein